MKSIHLRRHFSDSAGPELSSILLAAFAALWCFALWVARRTETGSGEYFYLVYNLGLAILPLIFSTIAVRLGARRSCWAMWTLWLLFLPNAPYLITDLIHLRPKHEAPYWFDWLMLVSFSGAGFLIGTISLSQAHRQLCLKFSAPIAAAWVWLILAMTSFGIYLGRFPRWNSWDIITRPVKFFSHLANLLIQPWEHPVMVAYCFGVTVILGGGYFGPLLIHRFLSSQAIDPETASSN